MSDRLWSRPLIWFLAVAAAITAGSYALAHGPGFAADPLVRLQDGDLERAERLGLLAGLAREERDGPDHGLAGLMALVALEREPDYRRRLGDQPLPFDVVPNEAICDIAGLGDPVLRPLLRAMALEAAGHRDEARRVYRQVERSSELFRMTLAGKLAAEGAQRLR